MSRRSSNVVVGKVSISKSAIRRAAGSTNQSSAGSTNRTKSRKSTKRRTK